MLKVTEKYVDQEIAKAKEVIARGKEFHAHLYSIYRKDNELIISGENVNGLMVNSQTKKMLVAIYHEQCRQRAMRGMKLMACFLISDTYVTEAIVKKESEHKDEEKITKADLDINESTRTEALAAVICDRQKSEVHHYPYARENGAIVWKEKINMPGAPGGIFNDLFP